MSRIINRIPGVTIEGDQIIFQSNVVINGGMVFGPAITQNITIPTNNDYIITGITGGVLVRLTSTGNFNITGLVNPDTTQGLWVIINNVGTNNITLNNNDAASLANNRFLLGTSKTLQPDEGITIIYDTVSLRWRPFGVNI